MMILMATIFITAKDEVQVSSEYLGSRDAFTKADITNRMAVYLARTALYGSPGEASDSLAVGGIAGRPEFAIALNNLNTSGFIEIKDKMTDADVRDRYILATDGNTSIRPHVEVYYQYDNSPTKRQLVGTAAVAIGTDTSEGPGSQGDPQYDSIAVGGYNVRVFLVVSANGRVPLQRGGGPLELDPSNYYTGTEDAKHSIVTAIFQEIMQ